MDVARISTAFAATLNAARRNARLRAAERLEARERARRCQATRGESDRPTLVQRIDASIDLAIACAATVMLLWLLREWQ